MATVKEYLWDNRDNIHCQTCGNCCPSSCEKKTAAGKCEAYPKNPEDKDIRPDLCRILDPVYLCIYLNYACSATRQAIKGLTGLELEVLDELIGGNGFQPRPSMPGRKYVNPNKLIEALSLPVPFQERSSEFLRS